MSCRLAILKDFAPLLRYPGPDYSMRVDRLLSRIGPESKAAPALGGLLDFARSRPPLGLEEEYTRTFDINPTVTLDVGFHLFGLAYKRGEFLVKVREGLREVGLAEGTELPDHLPTLLELASVLDEVRALPLVGECIFPAVERMCRSLATPAGFQLALAGLREYLRSHFQCVVLLIEESSDEERAEAQAYVYAPMELDDLQTGVARHG